ncbi:hypothetical protein [Polymorphobacter fuscus]|uniref:Uncharacterized protein n=1 Tax=Sandarakinorhabdus fusca TaxID=1439888 RepID=A0A7C9LI59_9SPHN|nr:hypothetical protein [Polymorphobacter fuscus]KAB7643624.1 hypothetical protein F9290_15760 [Polymorphobacter fuscus]MQT18707.1 hypothetical protein [Polymorphobacter fuscus]NJC09593.1 hypothetical protein [Polymorphobacter fuscus]
MNSNQRRIFDSVVSVDAWHTSFDNASQVAAVHVDVSFLRGKLGDEPESPVRFEVSLSKAEVVFIIPAGEPLSVIQTSVRREQPLTVQKTLITSKDRSMMVKGNAGLNIDAANTNIELSSSGGYSNATNSQEQTQVTQNTGGIAWAQSKLPTGEYVWQLAPANSKALLGKAWDSVLEPLLKIKNMSKVENVIESVARIEVRCRREDLVISNFVIKDQGVVQNIKNKMLNNKIAAAEAYIRNSLSDRNLDVRNFSDPYGSITLADLFIEKQIEE